MGAVHISKSGGRTLYYLLDRNFGQFQIYPYDAVGKRRILAEKLEIANEVINEFPQIKPPLVRGHFPIWFYKAKDPNYDTSYFFIVLREPIATILSLSRFLKRDGVPDHHPLQMDSNFICKMLSSDCTLKGEELLKDAIQNLERMDFIIFMEDFNNGVRALFKDLNLHLPNKIPRLNATKKELINDEIIEILKERNALDIRLYEYAKEHYNPDTHTLNHSFL